MESSDPLNPDWPQSPTQGEYLANILAAVRDRQNPTRIGRYLLTQLIAEGGMGSVYKAEQHNPIKRTVAIKIIKLGMDTREVIARFESERQALALMNHPNVARALDAGATDTGRPFFVMEFVEGAPITTFADQQKLTIRQRLELFTQACDAVQHAHQKAIIHRDLKPSNILVTMVDERPQVKVIDFGIAKAISHRLTEHTMFTETGQLMGTPEYMSPEQAENTAAIELDTRTDVYSLGVVLYELLSGALPFDPQTLRSAGYAEILRIIRDVDPPRPSTRLSGLGAGAPEVATRRQASLESLSRQLKTELEWIPLKAMRKDRDLRYSTAAELSDDIQNYLSDRPLRAGPESRAYRARKFLRRNKTSVAASAAMLTLLLGGIVATSWQAVRATRAESRTLEQMRRAEEANQATAQVNAFLVGMFESVDPKVAQGRQMLVKDVLDSASRMLPDQFSGRPRIASAIRSALGRTYLALGLFEQSQEHLEKALEIDVRELGPDDPQSLVSRQYLGLLRRQRGDYDEARKLYEDTLARRRRVLGERHIETLASLSDLAVVLDLLGSREAEGMYRQARDGMIEVAGRDNPRTLRITGNLGQLLQRVGKYTESENLLRESYDGRLRELGPDNPDTIGISTRLAYVMRNNGKLEQAESLMRDGLARSARVNGANHPSTIFAENGLAQLLCEQMKYDEGLPLYLHAVAQAREHLGSGNPNTFSLIQAAATALSNAGRTSEGEQLLREAVDGLTKLRGPDDPGAISASMNLCHVLQRQGRWEDSLPLAKAGFERLREPGRIQMQPARRAYYLICYGECLSKLGQHEQAIGPLIFAREALGSVNAQNYADASHVLRALIDSSRALGRTEDAARWSAEFAAARATTNPTSQPAGQ